jgi:hypothetical protein
MKLILNTSNGVLNPPYRFRKKFQHIFKLHVVCLLSRVGGTSVKEITGSRLDEQIYWCSVTIARMK